MCTVTFIPQESGFCLTSSRDESPQRLTEAPRRYPMEDEILVYPRDTQGGGSWIAASSRGRVACLMNGAFEKHERKAFYTRSRGQIVLESFRHDDLQEFVFQSKLQEVEPFTLLLLDYSSHTDPRFLEFRWDGKQKYMHPLSTQKPQIWSSATLYDEEAAAQREIWFTRWLKTEGAQSPPGMLRFHQQQHGPDPGIDILMKRSANLQTVSISQIRWQPHLRYFWYQNLVHGKTHIKKLAHVPASC